jgi:hypothetical protein
MKSVIIIAFFISLSTAQSGPTLSQFIDIIVANLNRRNSMPAFSGFGSASRDCLNQKLKTSENGEKIVNEEIAMIAVASTLPLCVFDGVINNAILTLAETVGNRFSGRGECLKSELRKHEPDATILEDFDSSSMEWTRFECEEAIKMDHLDRSLDGVEENYGKIAEITCGSVTRNEIRKTILKLPILKFGNLRVELKNSEIERLKDWVKAKAKVISECMVREIEEEE